MEGEMVSPEMIEQEPHENSEKPNPEWAE